MSLPEHPFERVHAESAALKQLAGGPELSISELAEVLGVEPPDVAAAWRGEEPLSIGARRRLADLLEERRTWLRALEKQLRRPLLQVESGTSDTAGSGVHGHAHIGAPEGRTPAGIPVFNVALPVLRSNGMDFRIWTTPAPERRRERPSG